MMQAKGTDYRVDVDLTFGEVARAIDARPPSKFAIGGKIKGVSTDSRRVEKGDLFFAIRGEKFDGHDFAKDASTRGAALIVAEREIGGLDALKVSDSVRALGMLAAHVRSKFTGKVAAVTGSNGKTTTKNIAASILSKTAPTIKTTANLNNHIGLPLTILGIGKKAQFLVCELGMNHRGEIKYLCGICRPDVGVVTNIGPVHLEFLRDIDGVKEAKKELFDSLTAGGMAVVNIDDAKVAEAAEGIAAEKFTYSLKSKEADLFMEYIGEEKRPSAATRLAVWTGGRKLELISPLAGLHNAYNAAAAISVAIAMGAKEEEITAGLRDVENEEMRLEIQRLKCGATLINDCYNANPASTEAALTYVSKMEGIKYFVFGDMLELGESSDSYHEKIGMLAARLGFSRLMLYGPKQHNVEAGARKEGMKKEMITIFPDHMKIYERIRTELGKDSVVLVKGSRGMRMEEVSKRLIGEVKG